MSLLDAPVGCVPIIWNNVDVHDLAPETPAMTVLNEIARLGFAGTHVSKAEARALYEDRTPPPTPAEVEARQLERLFRQSNPRPTRAPGRRDQRALRRLKGIT